MFYQDPERPPDELWISPYVLGASGETVRYLAAGPAFREFVPSGVAAIDRGNAPEDFPIELVLERDRAGRIVFGMLNHTMN